MRPLSGQRLAWLAAWIPVLAASLLAALDAFELGRQLALLAVLLGLLLLGLTMAAAFRELRTAETETSAALERAVAAEASERARAEELRTYLTETQRMQRQLVQASKLAAVGELAAAVAHQVNNPLTGIMGFAELLMAELPEDDPRHEEAEVIHTEALRARGIVRALLEFSRSRASQPVRSDPNAVLRSAVDLVRFRAQEAGVRIVEKYRRVPELEVDPESIEQVLLNLFGNAFEAMPKGGELRVSSVAEGGRVGLVVVDTGFGMDDETRGRVFTPFFSARAGADGGTGLGLSVGLQIVESHGGTIEVVSEAGKGSTFTVWLPVEKPYFTGAVIVPESRGGAATPGKGAAA
jgi:two-component system NtrC family sensor kinase